MLVGPVFTREAVTAPRRPRHFVARATYVSIFLLLMCTAWLVLAGTQLVRSVGDLARFGVIVFQILAPLQLALVLFFAALSCAAAVSQEKDRRTLILLLVTDLRNHEVVLGKLLASLLGVFVLIAASVPLFVAMTLLGGVELAQIGRVFAITLLTAVVAGSLGSTIALWREKTFQSLALTSLVLVFWLGAWEIVARLPEEATFLGLVPQMWAAAFSPWRAVLEATRPSWQMTSGTPGAGFFSLFYLAATAAICCLLNGVAILRLRRWNPSREVRSGTPSLPRESLFQSEAELVKGSEPQTSAPFARGTSRRVWTQPVLWREMRTWAYGRKVLAVRATYLVLFLLGGAGLAAMPTFERGDVALVAIPLFLLSLILINAQGVTSLTTERDSKSIDLLLVTLISPREFVFGKLLGVFYNCKEMVLLPLLLCGYLWWREALTLETFCYLAGGLLVMDLFVAVVGLHSGLIHETTRIAIGTSLGTVFFLFVGVATCMRIMVAFSGSFHFQLAPFLAVMLGGGVGLYVSLGARNASNAIFWASFICPFATFYAITSFLLGDTLAVFLVTVAAYGFATAAMLVPAVHAFDVATGRALSGEG